MKYYYFFNGQICEKRGLKYYFQIPKRKKGKIIKKEIIRRKIVKFRRLIGRKD